MSSDLVERLKTEAAAIAKGGPLWSGETERLILEAAAELTRLRSENAEMCEMNAIASRIAQVMDEESMSGAYCEWRPCSGCYDTEDGYPTASYAFSQTFKCDMGSGCSDCGGLGVMWHHYSAEMLDEMQREVPPICDLKISQVRGELQDTSPTPVAENACLRSALSWYADQFCELGNYHECCGNLSPDECSGCKARALLSRVSGSGGGK